MTWKTPVTPTISQDYCEHLLSQDNRKSHAFDTMFRYSAVMDCARKLSYEAAGFEPSDPMDGPSLAITGMGSLLHEDLQDAYLALHPEAVAEKTSQIGALISGSADLFDGDTVFEIKTVGAFKFDMAVGLKRMGRDRGRTNPKGPSLAHVCQGGMNARALGASKVRIVYVSREAVSVALAEEAKFSSVERFCAEWLIGAEIWEPLVDKELDRLTRIKKRVDAGEMTPRVWLNEGKDQTIADPEKTVFPCGYCSHKHRCLMDGPGFIQIRKAAS